MKSRLLMMLGCVLGLSLPPAHAGGDHDHGEGAVAVAADSPRRLADGSVALPKPAQRQLGVRTLPAQAGAWPRALELNGRVTMDPNAGGRVQALLAGRLEAGPRGFPVVGQRVARGAVLAYVVPAVDAAERVGLQAQRAELAAARTLAEKRVARLRELADTVPGKDIEAAESELASLTGRLAAIGAGLTRRDALVAPVAGVIAASKAVAGQVVDARETVFEVVDPRRLLIEARAFDAALISDIAGATLAQADTAIPLTFVGGARSLDEGALPLVFRGDAEALAAYAVGQPVKLTVQTRGRVNGIRVPAAALARNPANQTIVWVKAAPERFVPRTVTVAPLDGSTVALTAGVAAGERVVVEGAALINQIR